MSNKNSLKISKKDYSRVLVTETIPYETPLIFSNDGFYNITKTCSQPESFEQNFFNKIFHGGTANANTIPYQYKIRKNASEFRRLSVIHPLSQWKMRLFYETYEQLICHYCSISKFSIRAPLRTASLFYYKNSWEDIGKFKRGSVDGIDSDNQVKHSSSFFSYRGYPRLYKFFNSKSFLDLEKEFAVLKTLDVSKCFDSIYTHSIAWATKDKKFLKKEKSRLNTFIFGNDFDELIRMANHNETNGIVIGPEISRIFAEIIFQDVDHQVEKRLSSEKFNMHLGVDYCINRYVDDVFIFARSESKAAKIYEIYADVLSSYKLHVNTSKSKLYLRPFFTSKSKVIREVNCHVNTFTDKFLEEKNENTVIIPKEIHRIDSLTRSFIDSIKATCSAEEVGYDEVSSYIVSAFFERTKRLINIESIAVQEDAVQRYKDSIIVFLEVMYFFYSVAPSVSASYKFCAAIILLCRFSEAQLGPYQHTIKQRVFDLSVSLLDSDAFGEKADVENFISLEVINVILSLSDLGDNYLLPTAVVEHIFGGDDSYFNLVSCLFYIKNHSQYKSLMADVLKRLDNKLQDLSTIQADTELACMALDSLTCPYIDNKRKRKYLDRMCKGLAIAPPNKKEFSDFLLFCSKNHWFINWREVDLLNALERKELRHVY